MLPPADDIQPQPTYITVGFEKTQPIALYSFEPESPLFEFLSILTKDENSGLCQPQMRR